MKKTIVTAALALFAAMPALAGQPNLYTCKSRDGKLQLSYASSSITGDPTASLSREGQALLSDPDLLVSLASDITMLGEMVTVSVRHKYIADAPSKVYAFLIPGIELGSSSRGVSFDTILLEGYNGGFMALPAVYQRVQSTTKIHCNAQFVMF